MGASKVLPVSSSFPEIERPAYTGTLINTLMVTVERVESKIEVVERAARLEQLRRSDAALILRRGDHEPLSVDDVLDRVTRKSREAL
jgi:hypothetical protein